MSARVPELDAGPGPAPWGARAALLLAIISGVILRGAAGESLWLDELHTSWTVAGSLWEVAERAAIGNQPPLYFWCVWLAARLPLAPETALRSLSLLAGAALPLALAWAAPRLVPRAREPGWDLVPIAAAWLAAIDPIAIWYSREARPYALLQLVAVLHVGLLAERLDPTKVRRPGVLWALTGALLVHLHYTGGWVLLAELVAWIAAASLARRGGGDQGTPRRPGAWGGWPLGLADVALLALLLAPLIPGVLAVAERRGQWARMVDRQPVIELALLYPWTGAILVLCVAFAVRPVLPASRLVLLASWLLVPLTGAWVATELDVARLFHKRYLISVLPASILAAAACVRIPSRASARAALTVAVLGLALASGGVLSTLWREGRALRPRREDWRGAIAALNRRLENGGPGEVVLLRSGLLEADVLAHDSGALQRGYCLSPVLGAYRLSAGEVHPLTTTRSGQLSPALRDRLRGRSGVWILARGSGRRERRRLLEELRRSLEDAEVWAPEPPSEHGTITLQHVRLRGDPRAGGASPGALAPK